MKDALGHGSNPRNNADAASKLASGPKSAPAPVHDSMASNEPPTPVLFKKDSEGGVYAAFPTIPGDYDPGTMASYAHVGQHSAAHQSYVSSSKPAKPHEYAGLLSELRSIGYNPKVVSRMTQDHKRERKAALK